MNPIHRTGVVLLSSATLLAVVDGIPARSQESSVQLDVPFAPVLLNVGGTPHLVHELHVTNFRPTAITLRRLQVLADGAALPVLDVEGASLASLIGGPGLARDRSNSLTVNGGQRHIVYLWTALGDTAVRPVAVRHRLDLTTEGRPRLTVVGGPTPISTSTIPEIDPPLSGGPWVAIYDPLLVGGHRTTLVALEGRARIPGRFAVDWVPAPADAGARVEVDASRGFVAGGFGTEVLAVASGVVIDVRDGRDDLPDGVRAPSSPMSLPDASGNHIVLDIANGRFAVYEHLQRGSVAVSTGDRVERGQVIARLGSSGSTSLGPHLHFHVADSVDPLASEGQPFVIRRFERLGTYPSIGALLSGDPWRAASDSREQRQSELPGPMSVVRF